MYDMSITPNGQHAILLKREADEPFWREIARFPDWQECRHILGRIAWAETIEELEADIEASVED